VPTHRSAKAFARGGCTGVTQHPDPFGGQDRVERGSELRVTTADQESELAGMLAKLQQQSSCLLGHPRPCRLPCHA
jgi:hypothetical protein